MEGAAAAQNFVQACNIGGDRFGVGLFAGAHDNFFGGLSTNIRNPATPSLIGGRDAGVILSGAGTSHNTFIDVRIGGGAGNGVEISDGASSNVFRTMLDVEATTISGNGGSGVVISGAGSLHNSFDRVPIFGNRGIAIDLVTPPDGPPGLNPNDPLDADNGANTLLNHPVIASAVRGADGVTTIRGSIDTAPNITVELQFFADEMPLTGDFGPGGPQAARPLGKVRVGTDATGHAEFSTTVVPSTGNPGLQPGQFVTALASIAMDNFGDASELSPAVRVDAAPQVAQIYVNGSGWAQRFSPPSEHTLTELAE